MAVISLLRPVLCLSLALAVWLVLESTPLHAADPKPADTKMIAGTAEVLRSVPKRFATLQGVDPVQHRVTLLIEGENLPKVWALSADAEIKVAGWWGRLEQLHTGDRVWAWFNIDRQKKPVNVLMLADDLSEQDIHGDGLTLVERKGPALTLKPAKGKNWPLQADGSEIHLGNDKKTATLASMKVGQKYYVQSTADRARLILDTAAFEAKRAEQKAALRKRWLDQGLPGTVLFLHISGEMELMLDHEAMRWGRALKPGDHVTLRAGRGSPDPANPIAAQVQQVRPWRERTQVRLVIGGADQADLTVGQRLLVRVPTPDAEIENSRLPPDLDRPRTKSDRVEWILASIYCSCQVKGDICTGQFYTLASCNPNGCGMPNAMRKMVAAKIDRGLTDKQIFEELLKEQGQEILRPHLLP